MKSKLFLATAALALVGMAPGYATSYEIWFGTPVQAGTAELSPGLYTVRQDGPGGAAFQNVDTGQVYKTPATVENIGSKNATSAITMTAKNGQEQLQTVAVGGQAIDLHFAR